MVGLAGGAVSARVADVYVGLRPMSLLALALASDFASRDASLRAA